MPIFLLNPYLAGGLFVDYLVGGRYPLIPERPSILSPERLTALTSSTPSDQTPDSTGVQIPGTAGDICK